MAIFRVLGWPNQIGRLPVLGAVLKYIPCGLQIPPVKPGDPLSLAGTVPRNRVLYMFLGVHMAIFRVLGWHNLMGRHPILGAVLKYTPWGLQRPPV